MALVMPNSVFLHIPKCGGSWVREAIKCAGIPYHETGEKPCVGTKRDHHSKVQRNHFHYTQAEPYFEGRFVFTFVRFPLKWYQSFWAYRIKRGRRDTDPWDEFMNPDFNRFVQDCCRNIPGALTQRYEDYTGWPLKVDFCGHQERLRHDLVTALQMAGEKFEPLSFRHIPLVNTASTEPRYKSRCRYTPKTRAMLIESERLAFERYEYNESGLIAI